jgi:hypothetical protein
MFSLDSLDPMTDLGALWPQLALQGVGFASC